MINNDRDVLKSEGKHEVTGGHITGLLESYTLSNGKGMAVTVINYGAAIAKIEVPDRDGKIDDVVLGHDDLAGYIGGRFYLGATVGRYANRIAGGRFVLNGKEYQVAKNKNGNMLHGGEVGFDKKFWQTRILEESEDPAVEMKLVSPDGDEGFPGTMEITTVYRLTADNELRIQYDAVTDKPTVINITNHSYFNLTGSAANPITGHLLTIDADAFTPTDAFSIPTGAVSEVGGTPLDFRKLTRIGDRIDENHPQLQNSKGYDKNFVLNNYDGSLRKAAAVFEPSTGRVMDVFTDQPGMQFYSGNYLDGTMKGKGGIIYGERSALCLECQHFPNSPNEKRFPSTVLEPGQHYKQTTVYGFSVR